MSKNCIRCVVNSRTGPDLLCNACRSDPDRPLKMLQLLCGPTCGCGRMFQAEANGQEAICPYCHKSWGRTPVKVADDDHGLQRAHVDPADAAILKHAKKGL